MSATFLVPSDGFRYTPSEEDKIILAAAIYGETRGEHSEDEWKRMLWTWFNRFALKVNRPWGSLGALAMAHSQPINPKWRSNGTFCKLGGRYHGKPNCSSARLSWRNKMANIIAGHKWESIPFKIRAVVQDFVDGKIPEPKTNDGSPMVDFAVTPGAKRHGTQYEDGGNYFLSYKQVQGTSYMSSFIKEHAIIEGYKATVEDDGWSAGLMTLLALPAGYVLYKIFERVFGKKR